MKLILAPIVQAFAVAFLAWLTSRLLPQYDFSLPHLRSASAIMSAVGGVILFLAVGAFLVQGTTIDPLHPERAERLVTTGLFRFSRNPMYLGMLLVLTSFALALGNLLSLLAPMIFVVTINVLQIIPEETALREKFGAEYESYCKQTRRWI